MRFDAVVIGAGPAGATAARSLAAAGWRVALVEKNEFPRAKVCGEFVSAPSLAVLDHAGIGDAFRAQAGPPVTRIGFFAGETQVTARPPRTAPPAFWGQALNRAALDTLLRDAARRAGAEIFQPREVTAVTRQAGGWRAELADGAALTAPVVIAAGGSWRVIPPFALRATERPSDLLAFKARFLGDRLAPGVMPLLAFPGGYGGMVHSDGGRLSLSCCIRRDVLAALRRPGERAGEAVLRHLQESTRGIADALRGAVPEGPVLAAGPIRPGIRGRYQDGIFFAGNLAGEAHPVIAEGISMAIQGSDLLARHLRATRPCGNLDGAGAAYAADWLKHFAPRLTAAACFAQLAMRLRGPGAQLVRRAPSLLSWGAALSGKS
jgi:flavin-dependent dehydrogenase